jgi:protein TonB
VKRLALAAALALIIHGGVLGFKLDPKRRKPPAKCQDLVLTLDVQRMPCAVVTSPDAPSPEALTANTPHSPEKEMVRPGAQVETPQARAVTPQKSAPRQQKKAVIKKRVDPLEMPADRPRNRPKPLPKPAEGLVQPEKESGSETVSRPAAPARDDRTFSAADKMEGDETVSGPVPAPRQDAIRDVGPEAEEKTASAPSVGEIVKARPAYRDNPRPEYPKVAKKRGYEGVVLLEVLVNKAGKVDDVRIAESSGHQILDNSAATSVKGWVFEPGSIGGRKVDMWVRVPVRYELRRD